MRDPWEDLVAGVPGHVEIDEWKDGFSGKREVQIIHCENGWQLVATSDLLTYVLKISEGQQQASIRLGNVLRKAGWERPDNRRITINKNRVAGWRRKP